MPMPYKTAKPLIRALYPLSSPLKRFFPGLGTQLDVLDSRISARDYLGGAFLTFIIYFIFVLAIVLLIAYRFDGALISTPSGIGSLVLIAFLVPFAVFINTLILPRWYVSKKIRAVEKDLLFATRHLMIQTTAGVPLFDAIVSVSEKYGDAKLDYGVISDEFGKIVVEVRTGRDLTEALEKSAVRNASLYYRKVIWQLANANRAGADIGDVLKNLVEYLSSEQRIMIQDYGSQLNPLALFYMLVCIIAPTMGLIFLMILSTFVELSLGLPVFAVFLLMLVISQIMFVGLIKSRRPRVAL